MNDSPETKQARAEQARTEQARTEQARALLDSLRGDLGQELLDAAIPEDGTVKIRIEIQQYRRTVEALHAHGLDRLEFITCVDRRTYLELLVQAYSMKMRATVRLTSRLERGAAQAPTISDLWPSANWEEREVYDQFGVHFVGHPDLRRILNPDRWIGHPLLKDYTDDAVVERPDYF